MKKKIKIALVAVLSVVINLTGQTLSEKQMQNARATGYAIVASKNPNVEFSIILIPWDGVNTLEHNANNQINPAWHPQAVIKGNYFSQSFDGTSFTNYSSVLLSQERFDALKHLGTQWWIVCSTLPAFSENVKYKGNVGIGTSNNPTAGLEIFKGSTNELALLLKSSGPGWGSGLQLHNTGSGKRYGMYSGSSGKWHFTDEGKGSRMVIDGIGNIGIGTSSPGAKLDVAGEVKTNSGRLVFRDNSLEEWYTNGTARIAVNYLGYQKGQSQFRDFVVYNGKGKGILYVNGERGNVGIGADPQRALHVVSSSWDNSSGAGAIFENNHSVGAGITLKPTASTVSNGTLGWGIYAGGPSSAVKDGNLGFWAHGTNKAVMSVNRGGKVGIGVNLPEHELTLKGALSVGTSESNDNEWGEFLIKKVTSGVNYASLGFTQGTKTANGNVQEAIVIKRTGSVGVGTNTMGSHKLAVGGSIGAREIKVEGSGWSDFVFYKDYQLPSLKEVENHIKEKGHLKDIPSAKEVDENGFFLGEMDAKLLQKIEELTLYTIKQEKKIKALEKQNSKIEKQEKELRELKRLVKKLLKDKN